MFKTQNLYQNDPKWKTKPLGLSSQPIGSWGCLLTSITMMLNGMGYNETPDSVNDKMKGHGGFQDAFLIPSVVPYVFPNVMYKGIQACETSPAPIALIDAAIAAGKPVILQVDWNQQAGLQTHFVLLKDRKDNDYLLYDPFMYAGDGPAKDVLLTKRYKFNGGTLETEISGVLWFDGYIPPAPPDPLKLPLPADKLTLYVAEDDLALRGDPSSAGYLWKRMVAGTELISLENKASALAKVGQQGQWLTVQEPGGTQGYVAAWYVSTTKTPPPTATTTTTPATSSATSGASTAAPAKPLVVPAGAMVVNPIQDGVAFRTQASLDDASLIRRAPMTEQFICIEPANQAIPKIGAQGQWLNVRDASGKTGYIAAWYVIYPGGAKAQAASSTPAATPGGPVKVKTLVEQVALRDKPVVNDITLIKRFPIGTELTLVNASDANLIGANNQWLQVQDSTKTTGYVAAWFVAR